MSNKLKTCKKYGVIVLAYMIKHTRQEKLLHAELLLKTNF